MNYPAPSTVPVYAPVAQPAPQPSAVPPGPLTFEQRQQLLSPVSPRIFDTTNFDTTTPDDSRASQRAEFTRGARPLPPQPGETQDFPGQDGYILPNTVAAARVPKRATAPRKKAPAAISAQNEPVTAPEPAATPHKKARTGAGARFNPDTIWIYRTVNVGILIVALAAVLISWQGLTAVAAWMLVPAPMAWIVPVAIDFAIVVFTIGILPRKARGESTWLLSVTAYLLTSISAAANFAHVVLESPDGTPDLQRYAGASLAALAPLLVLLTTEVLGLLITKPPRAENPSTKLRAAQDALAAATKEITSLKRAAAKAAKASE